MWPLCPVDVVVVVVLYYVAAAIVSIMDIPMNSSLRHDTSDSSSASSDDGEEAVSRALIAVAAFAVEDSLDVNETNIGKSTSGGLSTRRKNPRISAEVHRQFFHSFIRFGKDVLYNWHVEIPNTKDGVRCREYEEAGFPGFIGSMDATHISCERVPHDLRNLHTAFKLNGTARTYNQFGCE